MVPAYLGQLSLNTAFYLFTEGFSEALKQKGAELFKEYFILPFLLHLANVIRQHWLKYASLFVVFVTICYYVTLIVISNPIIFFAAAVFILSEAQDKDGLVGIMEFNENTPLPANMDMDMDMGSDEESAEEEQTIHQNYDHYKCYLQSLRFPKKINVAVIGSVKQGKSALINTILDYKIDAETGKYPDGAAMVEESGSTTQEPKAYSNPLMGEFFIWDMPGIEGFNNKMDEYLDKYEINTDKFDFFLVVISGEITTDAGFLIKNLHNRKLPFYLVRTHIDNTIKKGERMKKNESEIVKKVKQGLSEQITCLVQNSTVDETVDDDNQSIEGSTGINYQLYVVDGLERDCHEMKNLLNDIKIDVPKKWKERLLIKIEDCWTENLRKKMQQVRKESKSVIRTCAQKEAFPLSMENSEASNFVCKCLQLFQLGKKDIARFENMFELREGCLEKIADKQVSNLKLKAVRNGAKRVPFGDYKKYMSRTAKRVLKGVELGSAFISSIGVAGGGSSAIVGGRFAQLGVSLYVAGGVLAASAAVVALTTVGGVSVYRFHKLKKAYEDEFSDILEDLEHVADMVHKEKVSLCEKLAI